MMFGQMPTVITAENMFLGSAATALNIILFLLASDIAMGNTVCCLLRSAPLIS